MHAWLLLAVEVTWQHSWCAWAEGNVSSGRGGLPEEDEPVKHGVWLLGACKGDMICMAPDIGAWMSSEDSLLKLLAILLDVG